VEPGREAADVSSVLNVALTTTVIAGISWVMILQGMEKKMIVRRAPSLLHGRWPLWSRLMLAVRALVDVHHGKKRW
jgi:hypothetical protein